MHDLTRPTEDPCLLAAGDAWAMTTVDCKGFPGAICDSFPWMVNAASSSDNLEASHGAVVMTMGVGPTVQQATASPAR